MRLAPPAMAAAALLLALPASAQQDRARLRQPLLEVGVAGGGGWRPDYPAAEEGHVTGIVAPFVILRAEILRSDSGGARARMLRGGWGELSFSATGSTPTRSSGNAAREGMPDLGWMGEVGPALRLNLWRDAAAPRRLTLDLPVRAAFEFDLDHLALRQRGFTFAPELAFEQRLASGSRLRLSLGPVFGTARFMDTFYGVAPEFARPGREAYEARAGYLGTRLQLTWRMPVTERLSVVLGGRAEGYWGATNRESPLFRSETGFAVAAGFSWSFYRSETLVDASAEPFD